MKNISAIKNNLLLFFFVLNFLLSITGILSSMTAVKTDQYYSPFLYALPASNIFWLLFAVFFKIPDKSDLEKEFETYKKTNDLPDAKKVLPPYLFIPIKFIVKIISNIIILGFIIIILANFTMMFFIVLKMSIANLPCFP